MRSTFLKQRHALAASALIVILNGPTLAQEKAKPWPADASELDRRIYRELKEVINAGSDLYLGGARRDQARNPSATYYLYQGSLMTLKPLLGHHPDLQQAITRALEDAEQQPDMRQRAVTLRKILNRTRRELKPAIAQSQPSGPVKGSRPLVRDGESVTGRSKPKPGQPRPLWDRLGGEQGIRLVVDDWMAIAAQDPKANLTRNGKFQPTEEQARQLKSEIVAYLSGLMDGPIPYKGKSMREAHKGMRITDTQFDAAVADLRKALEGRGVQPAELHDLIELVEGTRQDIVRKRKTTEKKFAPPVRRNLEKGPEKKPDTKKEG